MAHRSQKNTSLPAAFDIRKYDVCSDFGWSEWYANLMQRTLRLMMFEQGAHFQDEMRQGLLSRFENPIAESMKIEEGDGYSKPIFRSQVTDMSAFDHLTGFFSIPPELDPNNKYRKAVSAIQRDIDDNESDDNETKEACSVLDVPHWEFDLDMGYDLSGKVHATVDLFASEEKLVEDFRMWLRATRTKLGVPNLKRRYTVADMADWARFRILAYLDLTMWAALSKVSLTQQQIGVALFPDEYGVILADRVRKVVAPLALSLATPAAMDTLYGQALEQAKKDDNDQTARK
ncbi:MULTISPECIES: DUF6387 family protein [unclassified Caballeronia]|uniref:DUF6387 family protein n=1 Tax=unclassified Caballeronia TaxID=2646786 RepID=UPI002029622D